MSNAEKPTGSGDPLFSNILAECPELWDVVEQFVRELPERVQAMQSALAAGEAERLAELAAQLRHAGLGHGCAELARRAGELEASAASDTLDGLNDRLHAMNQLVSEIQEAIRQADDSVDDTSQS